MTTDGDTQPNTRSRTFGTRCETHTDPSKELNMKASTSNVYDAGRAANLPQPNEEEKPASKKAKARTKGASGKWLVAGLLLLSAIPMAAGAFRLTELTGGAEITPANARFFASPLPVMVHIVSAGIYAVLGAFQFATRFRRPDPAGTGWRGGS